MSKLKCIFKPKLRPIFFELGLRKKKLNSLQVFSQIEKEADDDDEPPSMEVRVGPGKKRSPRKSPRKRKVPDLVKAPTVTAAADEEPSTSTGECQTMLIFSVA